MFEDIQRNCKDAIPFVNDLLCNANALLFFNNEELYSIFNTNLENLYKNLKYKKRLEFAPKVFKTHGHLLRILDDEDKDKTLCEIAVLNFGLALQYVPHELKNLQLVTLSIQESGYALKFANIQNFDPKEQRDLIFKAYQISGRNIRGHTWFEKLFQTVLKEEKRQECIQQEIDTRNDKENKWWWHH